MNKMTTQRKRGESVVQAPLGQLEQALIDEFVRGRGYDPLTLTELPAEQRKTLLKEASVYASGKLAEVEARSHFLDEIHDGIPGIPKTGLE
jgi:hypothetical protein